MDDGRIVEQGSHARAQPQAAGSTPGSPRCSSTRTERGLSRRLVQRRFIDAVYQVQPTRPARSVAPVALDLRATHCERRGRSRSHSGKGLTMIRHSRRRRQRRSRSPSPLPAAAQDGASAARRRDRLPTMDFGTWGFDPADLDPAVDPGDDFFAYVNGKWLARQSAAARIQPLRRVQPAAPRNRPPTSRRWSTSWSPRTRPPGTPTSGASSMPTTPISTPPRSTPPASRPAQPYLDSDPAARTRSPTLAALCGKPGYPSPLGGGVTVDAKEPDPLHRRRRRRRHGPARPRLLPRRQRARTPDDPGQVPATTSPSCSARPAMPIPPATAAAGLCLRGPDRRSSSWDRAMRAQPRPHLQRADPGRARRAGDPAFPVAALLAAARASTETDRFLVARPAADRGGDRRRSGSTRRRCAKIGGGMPAMMALLRATPLDAPGVDGQARFLNGNAAVLPSDDRRRATSPSTASCSTGTPEQRPRWKRAIGAAEGALGERVGALYVERYFPPASKAAMDELVANLRKAMALNLAENAWMSDGDQEGSAGQARRVRSQDRLSATSSRPTTGLDDRARRRRSPTASPRPTGRLDDQLAQARRAGRPDRVGHAAADGERLLQPALERDRVPGRHPAAAVLRA